MFGPGELKKSIENTLNSSAIVPEGHKVAFVTNYTNGQLHSAVAMKINDEWQISGDVNYIPTAGDWDYGVQVRWSK